MEGFKLVDYKTRNKLLAEVESLKALTGLTRAYFVCVLGIVYLINKMPDKSFMIVINVLLALSVILLTYVRLQTYRKLDSKVNQVLEMALDEGYITIKKETINTYLKDSVDDIVKHSKFYNFEVGKLVTYLGVLFGQDAWKVSTLGIDERVVCIEVIKNVVIFEKHIGENQYVLNKIATKLQETTINVVREIKEEV